MVDDILRNNGANVNADKSSSPPRRRLRFGLRAFFVFVTLVAAFTAWIGSEFAQRQQEQSAIVKLTSANAGGTTDVAFDSRFDPLPAAAINPLNPPAPRQPTGVWQTLRNLDLFRRAAMFKSFPRGNTFEFGADDAGRLVIRREYKSGLTDADMELVGKLPRLRSLWLEACNITDQGLSQLGDLDRLEILWLQHTAVTDAGLPVLQDLPSLRDLDLSGTYVTDAAVESLAKCGQLQRLVLQNTNVTPQGIATLQQRLPSCQIEN